jgi:hypothetical protein
MSKLLERGYQWIIEQKRKLHRRIPELIVLAPHVDPLVRRRQMTGLLFHRMQGMNILRRIRVNLTAQQRQLEALFPFFLHGVGVADGALYPEHQAGSGHVLQVSLRSHVYGNAYAVWIVWDKHGVLGKSNAFPLPFRNSYYHEQENYRSTGRVNDIKVKIQSLRILFARNTRSPIAGIDPLSKGNSLEFKLPLQVIRLLSDDPYATQRNKNADDGEQQVSTIQSVVSGIIRVALFCEEQQKRVGEEAHDRSMKTRKYSAWEEVSRGCTSDGSGIAKAES